MDILAVTSSYPRFEGDPTAPFIESITRALADHGHETDLVVPENRDWRHPASEPGIRFHRYRYSPRSSWTPWGFSEALEGGVKIRRPLYALAPIVFASALRTSNRLAARGGHNVVQAHWVVPNGPIAALAARRRGLPLVLSLHGSDVSVAQKSEWLGRIARWCFARADAVTAPSEDLLDRARTLGAKGRLELIPYGVDPVAFRPDPARAREARGELGLQESDVMVLGIGRFVHWKGFDDLLEAVAAARAANGNVRLVLVGDGDLRDDLSARAARLTLGNAVTFTGMASRAAMPGYLAAADIVAVPSIHYDGYVDGLPNVALEAMASGKPLVATRVGGLPQLIRDGEDGVLVEERDARALAGAIGALAGDPDKRAAMGERARARAVDSLTWSTVADRFQDVYESVRK